MLAGAYNLALLIADVKRKLILTRITMISMRGIVSQIQMYILARLQRKFKRMTIMRRRRGRAS